MVTPYDSPCALVHPEILNLLNTKYLKKTDVHRDTSLISKHLDIYASTVLIAARGLCECKIWIYLESLICIFTSVTPQPSAAERLPEIILTSTEDYCQCTSISLESRTFNRK